MHWAIKVTIGLIIAITLGLIGWDIVAATNSVNNSLDTISGRMRIWGKETPIIPFAWAVLAGHFWGPIPQLMPYKTSIPLLIFISWCLIVAGIVLRNHNTSVPPWTVLLPGMFLGALLWTQQ